MSIKKGIEATTSTPSEQNILISIIPQLDEVYKEKSEGGKPPCQ